jgi:hypothetical protein
MALAIPGGAPGYDDDKEFGNFITHIAAGFPKGCANIAGALGKSREGVARRNLGSLARFRAFGESENWAFCHALVVPQDEVRVRSHPSAASGLTHSNSGSWCRNQVNWRLA